MEVTYIEFQKQYKFNRSTDLLGEGSFGITYSAYSQLRNRKVAIKFYRDQNPKHNLKHEIQKAINLDHPNLIKYYYYFLVDFGTHKEHVSVMEFADGGDFSQFLKKKPLVFKLKELIKDVLEGLLFLEDQKIIHRDIKLENILLFYNEKNKRYVAKICDFGLAESIFDFQEKLINENYKTISGTPSYMAPELIDGRKYGLKNSNGDPIVSYNTDLWSLGVMLYYIFNDTPPFGSIRGGTSLMNLVNNILIMEIREESFLRIPYPFREIARKCLTKNAEKRVSSAKDLLKLLAKRKKIILRKPDKNK